MSDNEDGFDVRSLAITFRPGAHLARHSHRWGQLVFATSGIMRVITDDEMWLVPPTKAIWLPPGVPHRIVLRGEVAMRTLYIAGARAASLANLPAALEVAPLLRELILHILRIGMLAPTCPEQDRLAGLLIDLLLAARPEDLALPLPRDKRARHLADRILDKLDDAGDLATLAAAAGASHRTLQRIFPRETGLTLEAWRQKARLIHAIARLTAGSSVTNAAFECGYQSVGSFIRIFARQFGTTPGRYMSDLS